MSPLPESALCVRVGCHSHLSVAGVCGDGVVVDRVSVGVGGRWQVRVLILLSGSPRVARAPPRGSGVSIGGVSAGCSRDAAGGSDGAQLLSLGPRLSPVVCRWGSLFVVSGV